MGNLLQPGAVYPLAEAPPGAGRAFQAFQQLGQRLREARTRPEAVTELLQDKLLQEYLGDALGVVYGAFGVADKESNEFILLEGNHQLAGTHLPLISFPFLTQPPPPSGFQAVIDLMFLGLRRSQVLNVNPPEFFSWMRRPPGSKFEPSLRDQLTFRTLHCPAGEVTLYLYAWRWLLRHCQLRGGAAPVRPDDPLDGAGPGTPPLWDAQVWGGEGTLEGKWRNLIMPLRPRGPRGGRADLDAVDFDDLKESWLAMVDRFDERRGSVLLAEWQTLGLAREGLARGRRYLLEALQVAAPLADDAARQVFEGVLAEPRESDEDYPLGEAAARRLDALLREALYRHLAAQPAVIVSARPGAPPDGFELLRRLHKVCRFPLIPFYYASALAGGALEHLVLSVWESYAFPAEVEVGDGSAPDVALSPEVVFALLLLKPYWRLPAADGGPGRPWPLRPGPEDGRRFARHIDAVHQFSSRLAHPIIDQGFYNGVVGASRFQEGQQEELRSFAHHSIEVLLAVERQLEMDGLLRQMHPATRVAFMLLKSTIARYRRAPHDPTLDFPGVGADPLPLYVAVAAAHAVQRGMRSRSLACRGAARKLLAHRDMAERLLAKVGWPGVAFRGDPAAAAPALRKEQFAVLFILALGQALYHTLRCVTENDGTLAGYPPLRVEVEVGGPYLRAHILNPGGPAEDARVSNDVRDFQQMKEYFQVSEVNGPRYAGERSWSTELVVKRDGGPGEASHAGGTA